MPEIVTAVAVAEWGKFPAPLGGELVALEATIDAVESAVARSHTVPDPMEPDFKQAVLMQSVRLWLRRQSATGISQFGPEFVVRVNRFDPDIDDLLAPFRKWVFG